MNKKQEVRETLVEALAQSPMLKFLGKHNSQGRGLREMLEKGQLLHFEAGEAIIVQGETSDAVYVLASGTVAITLDGVELCALDEPGEVFGEFGAFTGELRSATVTARDAVTAFAVGGSRADRLALEEDTMFGRLIQQAFAKILLARLRQSNEELVELRKALTAAENQAVFLRMDNEVLNKELDAARKELHDGLRGTRSGSSSK